MEIKYIVLKTDENKKLKDILQDRLNISHRLLITLKSQNNVYVNNEKIELYKTVKENDVIYVNFDYDEDNSNILANNIHLDIIYEDEWIIAINKQSGIAVHPSVLHYNDSLSNGIKYYYDSIGLKKKIRPIIRIDKDTSGIVVFAKCEYIQEQLIKQMNNGLFNKEYIAVVEGNFENKKGTINAPIARKENSIIERCVDKNGADSITEYEIIDKKDDLSIVRCKLKTGRTHQIRVHMSYIGHPLLGDDLYGGNKDIINRQALHCYKLSFIHPITNKEIKLLAALPDDMKKIINK